MGRAITSIRGQTLAEWELVVVDDGSTDDTSDLLRAAAQEDARIRVIGQPALGLVAALNTGLSAARGAFVARMDADDESHPERLARQVAVLDAQPRIGVVSCLVEFGGDRAANAGYALHVDWLNSVREADEIGLNRFVESPLAHPSVVFRRSVVERWGGYRAGDFPEDYELWLRWLDRGVVMAKVPETLVTWHDAQGRLSRTDSRYGPEAFFRLKAEYLALHLARIARTTVWIWGAGRPTRKRAAMLTAHGVKIAGYIDVDRKKTGVRIAGVPVIAAEELPPADGRFILSYVSKRGARDWIRGELRRRNYVEGRDFLACA